MGVLLIDLSYADEGIDIALLTERFYLFNIAS
jgi:hypothetical protein